MGDLGQAEFSTHLNRQRYDKTFHGPLLLLEMGLPAVRRACPRFDGWIARLQALAAADQHRALLPT